MDQQSLITSLKEGAQKDPVTNAVLQVFAARKRARQTITVSALEQSMKKHGFAHKKEEYASSLKFFSSLGIGHLETDKKGRVKALKDVKVTLQSLGAAAAGTQAELHKNKARIKFTELQEQKSQAKAKLLLATAKKRPVSLSILVDGRPLSFVVPETFNELEIAQLIVVLRDRLTLP